MATGQQSPKPLSTIAAIAARAADANPGGGSGLVPIEGSPEGVVTGHRDPDTQVIDVLSGAVWVFGGTDGTNTGWITSSGWFVPGDGAPLGVLDSAVGTLYSDFTNGTLYFKVQAGVNGWVQVTGTGVVLIPGLIATPDGAFTLMCGSNQQIVFTDYDGDIGHGNSLIWQGSNPDGGQALNVRTGDLGQYVSVLADPSGRILARNGLGVGNSAAASTPGSVVKKMEVFDHQGNSLGYVPLYDAIT